MNKALRIAIIAREPQLPQWKIAKRIGVDDSRMSGFVHGRHEPTPKQKRALARVLKTSVEQIFPSPDSVSA
jgi:transcriptional regulator with XRE-family HTH domain